MKAITQHIPSWKEGKLLPLVELAVQSASPSASALARFAGLILARLHDHGQQKVEDLARHLQCEPDDVWGILGEMDEALLVARSIAADGLRENRTVQITEPGRALIREQCARLIRRALSA